MKPVLHFQIFNRVKNHLSTIYAKIKLKKFKSSHVYKYLKKCQNILKILSSMETYINIWGKIKASTVVR